MMVLRFSPVSSGLFSLKMPNTRSARGMRGVVLCPKDVNRSKNREHRDQAIGGEC